MIRISDLDTGLLPKGGQMLLIDLKELAKKTSLSIPTLRKYLKKEMPYYRIERKILINPEEFCRWIQQYRNEENQEPNDFKKFIDDTLQNI